jgi:hypothetical protein
LLATRRVRDLYIPFYGLHRLHPKIESIHKWNYFFGLSGTVHVCCGLRMINRFRDDDRKGHEFARLQKMLHSPFSMKEKASSLHAFTKNQKNIPLMDATQAKKLFSINSAVRFLSRKPQHVHGQMRRVFLRHRPISSSAHD